MALAAVPAVATIRAVARLRQRKEPRGTLADRLRQTRARRGLSQDAAALSIGINRVTLARWETGEHAPRGLVLRVVEEWIAASRKGGKHGA
jgi:DNA-binding XRE family transcriptional regulator